MTREQAATAIGWLLNGPVKVHTFLEDVFGCGVADEIMEGLKTAVSALLEPKATAQYLTDYEVTELLAWNKAAKIQQEKTDMAINILRTVLGGKPLETP